MFDVFKNWSKSRLLSSLTSDSERASKIRGRAEFGLTSLFFSKNFQKIKNFNFFRKKVSAQKKNFGNSKPLLYFTQSR